MNNKDILKRAQQEKKDEREEQIETKIAIFLSLASLLSEYGVY